MTNKRCQQQQNDALFISELYSTLNSRVVVLRTYKHDVLSEVGFYFGAREYVLFVNKIKAFAQKGEGCHI